MTHTSKQPHAETRSAAIATRRSTTPAPAHLLLDLQHSAGNQAVSRVIELPLRGVVHPVAAALSHPGVRFRVPSFERLKAAYTDKTLKIPEQVIKDAVTRLLERMVEDGRLKPTTDSVPDIVKKIFPKAGVIDQTEFEKVIDVKDRTRIYESVLEADTKVKTPDVPKLKTAFGDAASLVGKIEGDSTGMTEVFGGQAAKAKTIYAATKKVLEDLSKNLGGHVFTDYNLDDPEVALGGFASHADKKMHLTLHVAQVKDPKKTNSTLIHEASHFADASVDDHVYYGNPGFRGLDEAKKVANAAHYEELPRRHSTMGTSKFAGMTFTPGMTEGGTAQTREDIIRAAAQNYMRMAWDSAVETHLFIRKVRVAYEKGDTRLLRDKATRIDEISRLIDLTVHQQAAGKQIVTTLDVTLTESMARAIAKVKRNVAFTPFPDAATMAAKSDEEVRDLVVADTAAKYALLLKDPVRDKKMLQWFVDHYGNVEG